MSMNSTSRITKHGVDLSKVPEIADMSPESVTANTLVMNSNCPDERTKFIFTKLIQHVHDFVRETSLTTEEWEIAIQFLTATGQKCTDVRQEFILLSDTLGISSLVEALNNAKPPAATEGSVLGPFFTNDAHEVAKGDSIASEGKGDYMFVEGRVMDTKGNPIADARIDTWETDGDGQYDNEYENREEPDCRGVIHSGQDGYYSFRAVRPVSYSIPQDGPVGAMMRTLHRHTYRPAHLHFKLQAEGYETLTTAVYWAGDDYLASDAVFGVRDSLIVDPPTVNDAALARARGFKDTSKPHVYLKQDFVLATPEEGKVARELFVKKLYGRESS